MTNAAAHAQTQPVLEAIRSPVHVEGVTLAVRDIAGVAAFYRDVLGLEAAAAPDGMTLAAPDGTILMRLVAAPDARIPARGEPGLFHTAFVLPERDDLARWVRHAQHAGVAIEGASDHLVSEAIYLSDPEGNGVEIYADRPRASWPRNGDGVAMATEPLDGAGLMALIGDEPPTPWRFPAGGLIGHVHLKVGDLAAAEAFYVGELGMQVMARYPGAVFMSWGGYHHHIAVNVWSSNGVPPRRGDAPGLAEITLHAMAGGTARHVTDPAGNRLVLQASASMS